MFSRIWNGHQPTDVLGGSPHSSARLQYSDLGAGAARAHPLTHNERRRQEEKDLPRVILNAARACRG